MSSSELFITIGLFAAALLGIALLWYIRVTVWVRTYRIYKDTQNKTLSDQSVDAQLAKVDIDPLSCLAKSKFLGTASIVLLATAALTYMATGFSVLFSIVLGLSIVGASASFTYLKRPELYGAQNRDRIKQRTPAFMGVFLVGMVCAFLIGPQLLGMNATLGDSAIRLITVQPYIQYSILTCAVLFLLFCIFVYWYCKPKEK